MEQHIISKCCLFVLILNKQYNTLLSSVDSSKRVPVSEAKFNHIIINIIYIFICQIDPINYFVLKFILQYLAHKHAVPFVHTSILS